MRIIETNIAGCVQIKLNKLSDKRGDFVKTFNETLFNKFNLNFISKEEYYSKSNKNVIRGFHFQTPPFDHEKIVYCLRGKLFDVVIDLRKNSKSFKQVQTFNLTEDTSEMIFIPKGCAHGFYSLENNSVMMYKVTTEYSPENDKGILWSSFNINWPVNQNNELIISERDLSFPSFEKFENPF